MTDYPISALLLIGGLLGCIYFGIDIGFDAIPFAVCSLVAVIGWNELRQQSD